MEKLKKIKILWADYQYIEKDNVVSHDGDSCWGYHDFDPPRIEIKSGIDKKHYIATLLHEIFHAIDYLGGLNLTEVQVRGLSNLLETVFDDNEWVRKELS